MKLTFGKYKGEDTGDVPLDYLKWLEEQRFVDPILREDLNYRIQLRTGDITSIGKKVRGPFSIIGGKQMSTPSTAEKAAGTMSDAGQANAKEQQARINALAYVLQSVRTVLLVAGYQQGCATIDAIDAALASVEKKETLPVWPDQPPVITEVLARKDTYSLYDAGPQVEKQEPKL